MLCPFALGRLGPTADSCSAARTALAIPSLLPSPDLLQHLENCSNEVQDRRLRQTELAADFLVALSLHHEFQHIELPWGQAEVSWRGMSAAMREELRRNIDSAG